MTQLEAAQAKMEKTLRMGVNRTTYENIHRRKYGGKWAARSAIPPDAKRALDAKIRKKTLSEYMQKWIRPEGFGAAIKPDGIGEDKRAAIRAEGATVDSIV